MNKQFKLIKRPLGEVQASDFEVSITEIPTAHEGELLIKTLYISMDPAMRGWMNDAKSYIEPVALGDVMRAGTVGKVIESKNPKYQTGDYVVSLNGVQEYAISNGKGLMKIDTRLAPLPVFLGTLGITGLTAYFGLLRIGQPQAGETVVVSGAAGAVGMVVGQIAKIKGCRVVGIAGGKDKCDFVVEELGFDACIDYKSQDVRKALKDYCPDGIDVYFDNVGGDILDAALSRLNRGARIPICGAISQYNQMQAVQGPKSYLSLLVNRARMEGFVVFDYAKDYISAIGEMAQWMQAGKLKSKEQVVEGIDNFVDTLGMLFEGKNTGKLVLKVAED
jgi:NADPH-dependent curcumin reductase